MADKTAIETLAAALGFAPAGGGAYAKSYADNYVIRIGSDGQVDYGCKIKLGDKTTSNLSVAESRVVLECVNRLLAKGYYPEDLTLEKKWNLGHAPVGGKADIVVHHRGSDKALMIIECKTWGKEYEKERQQMEEDGGQLFSYLQQDQGAQYLCLYASHWESGESEYRNDIVKIVDRKADEEAFEQGDKSIRLYRKAKTVPERYEVWEKTFNLYFHRKGIFEDDVVAYNPALKPLKRKDLVRMSKSEKVFNRFSEILRHNNISDNANAFNRVLSLILCKIVDETKGENEVLDFQVNESADNGERIQDRLHALYQQGMELYLGEKIVYYKDEDIRKIIKSYPDRSPLRDIEKIFREIKYYTNNEFAFKEVRNKELFDQNARVLSEIIKMLQNFRLRYNKKEPILGEFFERLLNHGVKQSEGQFFTPVPIVRFILLSLGVDSFIRAKLDAKDRHFLPKTLDYACGSGHFLTETMNEIRHCLSKVNADNEDPKLRKDIREYQQSSDWAGDYIFGVEKDYRLARTSQIACFLNGDGKANIIFGDGLEKHKRLQEDARKFDLVAANPPYSVREFKNYLNVGQENFSLHERLGQNAREIEVLFVERTAQALRPGGLAGIILPVSVLSNSGIYAQTRALLFEKFEFCGIAEFGSKTFIATSTAVVVLFLRRRQDGYAEDRRDIADEMFGLKSRRGKKRDYIDEARMLEGYAKHRGLSIDDYRSIVEHKASAAVKKSLMWKNYLSAFKGSKKDFCRFLVQRERDKFYLYMLCMCGIGPKHDKTKIYQSQITATVESGGDVKTQKAFLGYDLSNARGNEGVNVLQEGGMMYDDEDYDNLERACTYIRKSLKGAPIGDIPASLKKHVKIVNLVDCINFNGANSNNEINFKNAGQVAIKSRWNMVVLGDVAEVISGQSPSSKFYNAHQEGALFYQGKKNFGATYLKDSEVWTSHITQQAKKGDIVMSVRAPVGAVNINPHPVICIGRGLAAIRAGQKINQTYLFYYLSSIKDRITGSKGAIFPSINREQILNIQVPLPPMKIQKKIAAECVALNRETESAKKTIAKLQREMKTVYDSKHPLTPLDASVLSQYGYTATAQNAGDIRFLRITDIDDFGGIKSDGAQYVDANAEIKSQYLLSNNDIVIARSGSIGKMAIYKDSRGPMVFASFLVRLKTDNSILLPEYLFYFSRSDRYWEQVKNLAVAGNQPNLNAERIKSIRIPLPPISQQKKITAELCKKDAQITKLRDIIASATIRKAKIMEEYL